MSKVETSEFLKMLSRLIRAAGRRVSDADEHELAQLVGLRDQLEQSIRFSIQGQRSSGRNPGCNQAGDQRVRRKV